jgi:hypothetical protein
MEFPHVVISSLVKRPVVEQSSVVEFSSVVLFLSSRFMTNKISEDTNSEMLNQRTILLDIPPRLQWENGHGYCGETAIQSFGMYFREQKLNRMSVNQE